LVAAPRFTVLMPTHARPDVLRFAIQSVLDQTERDFELLVVGDGAISGTAGIVKSFADPRIRWFDLTKAAHFGYANRNTALKASRGELVAFAADDDLMLPDHLGLLGSLLDEPAAQLAYAQALWVSTDGIAAPDLTNLCLADELRTFLEQHNTVPAGAVVYRAAAFPKRAVWPEDVPQAGDWEIWKQLLRTHGVEAARYLRAPTMLHFSTARKNARDAGYGRLTAYLRIADHAPWWPQALRLAVPSGSTAQQVYSQAMRANPVAWTSRMREAAVDCVNRITLDLLDSRPAIADRDLLATELAALRSSHSWRLTAPLRKIRRLLTG
jgi:glycosyltransferase involved in cell wall biosynthesis